MSLSPAETDDRKDLAPLDAVETWSDECYSRKELAQQIRSLQELVCELLIKNERLRIALNAAAFTIRQSPSS